MEKHSYASMMAWHRLRWTVLGLAFISSCATSPPAAPGVPIFFADVINPPPTGACRLSISYEGGMESLGALASTVVGVDFKLTGNACGYRSKAPCTAAHSFHFGEVTLPVGAHQIEVGFQIAGRSWLYGGFDLSLMAAENVDCKEGLTRIRIVGKVPSILSSWTETKISFHFDGPSRSTGKAEGVWTSPLPPIPGMPGRLHDQF